MRFHPASVVILLVGLIFSPLLRAQESAPPADRAALELSDAQVEAGLQAAEQLRAAALAPLPDAVRIPENLSDALTLIDACCAQGALEAAERVVKGHPQIWSWDEIRNEVKIDCTARESYRHGDLRIHCTRRVAEQAIAIVVLPGTWAEPAAGTMKEGRLRAQDLMVLRPSTVLLTAGQIEAEAIVPIACAKYACRGPYDGERYLLHRYAKESAEERLAIHLCAGEMKPECETQMAVWMVRNGMTREECDEHLGSGSVVSFETYQVMRPEHAQGAAQVLMGAGIDPRRMPFFGGKGAEKSAPGRS